MPQNPQKILGLSLGIATPPPRLTTSEWADTYVRIPSEEGAEHGEFRTDRAPYQRGIMDSLTEPGVRVVSLMVASQMGKSRAMLNGLGKDIHLEPCPILFLQPTLEMAESFSKERFTPTVRDTPVLAERITTKSRDVNNTILHKTFPGGHLTFAGANSPSSLASRPVKRLYCDEIDRYPPSAGKEGDPIAIATRRTTNFWNSLIVLASTPTLEETSRISKAYKESDQRRFFVPCPHCGELQTLEWDNFLYPGKGTAKAKPEEIAYKCAHCSELIYERSKSRMVKGGIWKPTATGKPGHLGFQLSAFYSPWQSWIDIGYDFESARKDPGQLQVFWNTVLGLPYRLEGSEEVEWEKLYQRSQSASPNRTTFLSWKAPSGVLLLTAGVDVQADRLEVSLWGWGVGEEAWVLGHAQIPGDPKGDSVWESLDNLLGGTFDHEDGGKLKVVAACIDSGFRTQEVYQQVRKRGKKRWFAVKGTSSQTKPLIGRPKPQDFTYEGKRVTRGVKLYEINVDLAKSTLLSRTAIQDPGPKHINFASDLDTNFFEGICSEIQVVKHRGGQAYYAWIKKAGVRNEPLDCAVYAYVAANIAGLPRIRWDAERAKLANQRQTVEILSQGDSDSLSVPKETEIPVNQPKTTKKRVSRKNFGNPFA